MDLSNKVKSSLDEDLEVSSSDEEIGESVFKQEIGLLRFPVVEVGSLQAHASTSTIFYRSAGAAGPYEAQKNAVKIGEEGRTRDAEVEDRGIEYSGTPKRVLTLNKSTDRPGISDMALDEIIRQRNIHAPPRGHPRQNRLRFQHDPQVIPIVGLARDHHTIRRKHHYLGDNPPPTAQQARNEKLKKGVQSVTEFHPDPVQPILESEQAPEGYPEFRDEPWQCILKLINRGLSVYWSIKKLKNHENLDEEKESRLFRCLVSYNEIQGICEAPIEMLAKHGAAVDLLGKLSKEFPNLGRFPEKVNEALLIKKSAWTTLSRTMKVGRNVFYFDTSNDRVNNHALFKCVLYVDTFKYEGWSYLNATAAKAMATKMAFEDLLKEDCPIYKIYVGVEQCSSDQSLYRGANSHIVHCVDLSRSVFVKNSAAAGEGRSFPHRNGCVPVCHVKPKSGRGPRI